MNEVLLVAVDPSKAPKEKLEAIRELSGELELVVTGDREEIRAVQDRVRVVAGTSRSVIWQGERLRWVQLFSAGADCVMQAPQLKQGLLVTTASGMHGPQMAELGIGLLLALARGLRARLRYQQDRFWPRQDEIHDVVHLNGKTMLIAGLGPIGRHIGTIARAFGMKTIGFRRDPEAECPEVDRLVGLDGLDAALGEADVVMNVLPHTVETDKFFNAQRLGLLKPNCFFINLGRGKTVDEPALIKVLQEEQIAGAGLDVFETEPLPKDSPLWSMDNVLITPHEGGSVPDYVEQALEIFIDNLRRYHRGEPLRNQVDLELYQRS